MGLPTKPLEGLELNAGFTKLAQSDFRWIEMAQSWTKVDQNVPKVLQKVDKMAKSSKKVSKKRKV